MLHAIIMAGGSGTRLWPESLRKRPKQLLSIGSDKSLIRQSVDRISTLVPPKRIYLATNARLAKPLLDSAEILPPDAAIIEPAARNTAPCIALAAVACLKKDPDATMVVLTSDHRIAPEKDFIRCVKAAVDKVEKDNSLLITFGIVPAYPAESYGYIQRKDGAGEESDGVRIYSVKQFKEKPNRETAEAFLKDGRYFWNSGMFVWKAQTLLDNLAEFEPEMYEKFEIIAQNWDESEGKRNMCIAEQFASMKNISIDYAVMEKSARVCVIEADFDWDDIGSWTSLERLLPQDENGNTLDCARFAGINTTDTIVRCKNVNHLIAAVGVHDLAIIETDRATLVINKKNEEAVRLAVEEIRQNEWEDWL